MIQLNMKQQGFSLVEILVALTIIGIMMGGALTLFSQVKNAKKKATLATLQHIKTAVDQFREDTGMYPVTLKELTERPADSKAAARWSGPYMDKEVTEDSFGFEIQYSVNPKGQTPAYELYSYGPNGEGAPEIEWLGKAK